MAKQLLHRADVIAVLQQMGRERMAKRMAAGRLGNPGGPHGGRDRLLQAALTEMMPTAQVRAWIRREAIGGKDILPTPLAVRVGILAFERKGSVHRSVATF